MAELPRWIRDDKGKGRQPPIPPKRVRSIGREQKIKEQSWSPLGGESWVSATSKVVAVKADGSKDVFDPDKEVVLELHPTRWRIVK